MEVTIKTRYDDKGLKELKKNLLELNKKVRVGVPDGVMHPVIGIPISEVAMKNEFGFTTDEGYYAPPRPMLRLQNPFVNGVTNAINKQAFNLEDMSKEKCKKVLESIGEESLNVIQEEFNANKSIWLKNSPWTIKLKGQNDPLRWENGYLENSFTYEVTDE